MLRNIYDRIQNMKEYNLKHYAHLGDAAWELFIREYVIDIANTQKALHNLTVKYVNANFQALLLEKLELNEYEKEITKRGRNLPLSVGKKNNQNIHHFATAFEVLIGYLYINDKKRLNELFDFIKKEAL